MGLDNTEKSSFESVDDLFAFADGITDNDSQHQEEVKQEEVNITNEATNLDSTNEGTDKESVADEDVSQNANEEAIEEKTEEVIEENRLHNIGLDDPAKVEELHESWKTNASKLDALESKREYIEVIDKSGIKDVDTVALALEAANGNMDAMSKLIAINDIDPLDFIPDDGNDIDKNMNVDLDKYKDDDDGSVSTILFETAIAYADRSGVKDKFVNEISTWGEDSIRDIVKSENNVKLLTSQMADGSFEEIINEIDKIKSLDFSGKYEKMDKLDLYIIAEKNINASKNKVNDENNTTVNADATTEEGNNHESSSVEDDTKRLEEAIKASIQTESTNALANSANGTTETAEDRLNRVFAYADTLR